MKKNKMVVYILFLCIIVISLFFLSGCNNQNNSNEDIKDKVMQELDYIDKHIINIMNKLNNITLQNYVITSEGVNLNKNALSGQTNKQMEEAETNGGDNTDNQEQSENQGEKNEPETKINITKTQMEPKSVLELDENDINWDVIKNEIETINNSWGVILLDLTSLNIDNKDILDFSNTLNTCILSIKDEDKKTSLINFSRLYSFIPKYEKQIFAPNNIQNIKQVKSYIMNAYSAIEDDNWDEVAINIAECEKTYKNIINDIEYIKNREYKVNKSYVLIKELQNSLSYKDKKIFYIKYINLLESINTL